MTKKRRKRLTIVQALEIKGLLADGIVKTSYIMEKFECSKQTVCHIKNGRHFVNKYK